jgi:post-segregation antitoxin (ccd killing protein)
MMHPYEALLCPTITQPRNPAADTNVTLPDRLVAHAKALNVSISKACEAGLAVVTTQNSVDPSGAK